jgi:hypothetical protein
MDPSSYAPGPGFFGVRHLCFRHFPLAYGKRWHMARGGPGLFTVSQGPDSSTPFQGWRTLSVGGLGPSSTRPIWQGVCMDSKKFHPGPPCPTLLRPTGQVACSRLPPSVDPHAIWAVFYPLWTPSSSASVRFRRQMLNQGLCLCLCSSFFEFIFSRLQLS